VGVGGVLVHVTRNNGLKDSIKTVNYSAGLFQKMTFHWRDYLSLFGLILIFHILLCPMAIFAKI